MDEKVQAGVSLGSGQAGTQKLVIQIHTKSKPGSLLVQIPIVSHLALRS